MIQTTKQGLKSVIAAIDNAITTLEGANPIQDLKGRNLSLGDLVVLVNADDLDNNDLVHEKGDLFQFIGGEVDNIGCFMHCKYNKRSDFFADRTLKINRKLNFMENHWNSYGVFAIAIQLKNQNYSAIDVMWQEAIELYKQFYKSEWDDKDQSELECINKFMKHINQLK